MHLEKVIDSGIRHCLERERRENTVGHRMEFVTREDSSFGSGGTNAELKGGSIGWGRRPTEKKKVQH